MAIAVLSSAETERPVITAAAPPTALRIRKLRRSTPGGTSCEINRLVSASGSSRKASRGFFVELSCRQISHSLFDMVLLLPFIQIQLAATRALDRDDVSLPGLRYGRRRVGAQGAAFAVGDIQQRRERHHHQRHVVCQSWWPRIKPVFVCTVPGRPRISGPTEALRNPGTSRRWRRSGP